MISMDMRMKTAKHFATLWYVMLTIHLNYMIKYLGLTQNIAKGKN